MYIFMLSTCYPFKNLMKLEISRRVLKTIRIMNFMKTRPVGVELFHADQQNMTKLMVAFHSFVNGPKIEDVKRC
jgi:hypothetical protein